MSTWIDGRGWSVGRLCLTILAVRAGAAAQPPATQPGAVEFSDLERRRILQHSPLPGPPSDPTNRWADDDAAARLGQFLFFDERLSANGEISCATCHDPKQHFTDGKRLGAGLGPAERHTPGLWNVAQQRWFFWDGRADSLWSQALQPLESAREMGASRALIAHRISGDVELRGAYEAIFGPLPDLSDAQRFPPTACPVPDQPADPRHAAWQRLAAADQAVLTAILVNVGKAIAAYERRLVSRAAPFDRFVAGLRTGDAAQLAAISPAAQRGARLFVTRGNCRLCHAGPNFSDGEFHSIRVPPLNGGPPRDPGRFDGAARVRGDPFNARGEHSDQRDGPAAQRLEFLKHIPENWGTFRTPSLRNVALTAPYMHQGQFESLERVLRFYSTFEGALPLGHHAKETILQPLALGPAEIDDLRAFLESLTDASLDPALLVRPPSPR